MATTAPEGEDLPTEWLSVELLRDQSGQTVKIAPHVGRPGDQPDFYASRCIEASRLVRNGRDWHHLADLCALAATLVIDPDDVYDPRLVSDRLLLGLKGTMAQN